ncbi:MAG: hypothetical protein ACOYLP_04325 [Flavobacterium sp.]|uniref:hypothetical protein n=1 Tax=Flavobacterium sp. TaxID=239 RepID=UPI003BE2B5C3
MKLLKKMINYLKNIPTRRKNLNRIKSIQKNTIKLKKEKQSDINRWKNSNELFEDWDQRTSILGNYIAPGSKVIEFGSGNMSLKKMLPKNCTYTPSDIVKRTEETIVCDLNEPISFDLSFYNTAVFSGVFEYVYDIDIVFKQLEKHIPHIILSYACSDICTHNRLINGWLSEFTEKQLLDIFAKYSYDVIDKQEWRQQTIFNLNKKV